MTVREYVGARYVPLFADPVQWDNTKSYEQLTIVTYQGSSYTSRQAVPEGIDITNESYWVLTGNYNAQVQQYRTEVQQMESRVNTVVDDLRDDVEQTDTELRAFVNSKCIVFESEQITLGQGVNAAPFDIDVSSILDNSTDYVVISVMQNVRATSGWTDEWFDSQYNSSADLVCPCINRLYTDNDTGNVMVSGYVGRFAGSSIQFVKVRIVFMKIDQA